MFGWLGKCGGKCPQHTHSPKPLTVECFRDIVNVLVLTVPGEINVLLLTSC